MASTLDSFCIYHVTAPGQEPGAKDLPDGFVYPNLDELSEQVPLNIFFLCGFSVIILLELLLFLMRPMYTNIQLGRVRTSLLWDSTLCGIWRWYGSQCSS